MPSHSALPVCELTLEDRRRQVAAILVEGVLRFRRAAARAAVAQFSPPRDTGLEVLSETRLSVSRRLDSHAGVGRREVNDAGVAGDDEPGNRLRELLDARGIEPHVWVDRRPTTWKQRIVTRGQLRPDRCDREVTTPVSDRAERYLAEVSLGDILLVSDYGKGVCTRRLLESIGERAREANISILVDPARSRDWSDYGQVSLIKANWAEATEAASCEHPRPLALARKLSDAHGCDVVITLGRCGMVCAERTGATWHLPATPTEVRDVCGAGDTVLAALAVGLLTGKSLRADCQWAMGAAGRQVAAVGVVAVA